MRYAIHDGVLLRRPPGATLAAVELYDTRAGWKPFPQEPADDIRYSSIAAWIEAREVNEGEAGEYIAEMLGDKGYNPNQPREPAGSPDGGQFASASGGAGDSWSQTAGGAISDYQAEVKPPPEPSSKPGKRRILADTSHVSQALAIRRIADAEIDEQGKLFNRPPGTFDAPIEQLENIRARPEGIGNAARLMYASLIDHPDAKPRDPISVQRVDDSTYRIYDGNSTYAILRQAGWSTVPARLVDEAGKPVE